MESVCDFIKVADFSSDSEDALALLVDSFSADLACQGGANVFLLRGRLELFVEAEVEATAESNRPKYLRTQPGGDSDDEFATAMYL